MMPLGVNDRWNNKFDMEIRDRYKHKLITKEVEGESLIKNSPFFLCLLETFY